MGFRSEICHGGLPAATRKSDLGVPGDRERGREKTQPFLEGKWTCTVTSTL